MVLIVVGRLRVSSTARSSLSVTVCCHTVDSADLFTCVHPTGRMLAGVVTSFRGASRSKSRRSKSTEKASKKNGSTDSSHFLQPSSSRRASSHFTRASRWVRGSAPIPTGPDSSPRGSRDDAGSASPHDNRLWRTADDNRTIASTANYTVTSEVDPATSFASGTTLERHSTSRHDHMHGRRSMPNSSEASNTRDTLIRHLSAGQMGQGKHKQPNSNDPTDSTQGGDSQAPNKLNRSRSRVRQGSLLSRGRQWFRRKSDSVPSQHPAGAVGEGVSSSMEEGVYVSVHRFQERPTLQECLLSPDHPVHTHQTNVESCCTQEQVGVTPHGPHSHSQYDCGQFKCPNEAPRRQPLQALNPNCIKPNMRAAHAVAEGIDTDGIPQTQPTSAPSLAHPPAAHNVVCAHSPLSEPVIKLSTSPPDVEAQTPKHCGNNTQNQFSALSIPSGIPPSPLQAVMSNSHASPSSLSPKAGETDQYDLWRAIQSPQSAHICSPREKSEISEKSEILDSRVPQRIPNPTDSLSPTPNVTTGNSSGYNRPNSASNRSASPVQLVSSAKDTSAGGSSAGSYVLSAACAQGASTTGADAPSKLLSMGFASSNMSGTEWSHGSPSLAAEPVCTLNPGSRFDFGSDTREATEASIDCSPTIVQCASTTGELHASPQNIPDDSNTLGSLDGAIRMPVAQGSLTLTPSIESLGPPGTFMYGSHALRPSASMRPQFSLQPQTSGGETSADMHASDSWDTTTPRKRPLIDDSRRLPQPTSSLTSPYSPERSPNGVHACTSSCSGNTMSQSLTSPLQNCLSNGTVSMSLSIAPMSTVASAAISGDISSSIRGSPQKPPLSPYARSQYVGAARMHVNNQLNLLARRSHPIASVPPNGSVAIPGSSQSPQKPVSLQHKHGNAPIAMSLSSNKRRIAVRRRADRRVKASRGISLAPSQEEEEEGSIVSAEGSFASAVFVPERPQCGASSQLLSLQNTYTESPKASSIPQTSSQETLNPLGPKRLTDESGCGTTPNSSATLACMSGYKTAGGGTVSAPESGTKGSGGESDTCTGISACWELPVLAVSTTLSA